MIYVALIVVLVCLAISLYFSKADILSPAVLTCLVWLGAMFVYAFFPHNLNPMRTQFLHAITLWLLGFVPSALLAASVSYRVRAVNEPSRMMRDVLIVLSLLCLPHFFHWCTAALLAHPGESWGRVLRLAAIGTDGYSDKPYGGTQVYLWKATFLIELVYFNRKHWYRLLLASVGVTAFAVFTLSKSEMLSILVFLMVAVCVKNNYRLKWKYVLIAVAIILAVCVFIQSNRNHFEGLSNMFVLYFASSITAFDTLEPYSATHIGENVFVFAYYVLERLHVTHIAPVNLILPFVQVPIPTNTYTVMYPFFKDFGYIGVFVFALVLGFLSGVIYKMAKKGSYLALMLYAYFSIAIVCQYSGESFFAGMAGHLKFLALVLISMCFHFPIRRRQA